MKALPSLILFQIENRKIDLKVKSKVGSLDNVKHRPGGGDKKVFNDVEYLRQMSDTTGAQLMAKSATGSRDSSRRESAVQVCITKLLEIKITSQCTEFASLVNFVESACY